LADLDRKEIRGKNFTGRGKIGPKKARVRGSYVRGELIGEKSGFGKFVGWVSCRKTFRFPVAASLMLGYQIRLFGDFPGSTNPNHSFLFSVKDEKPEPAQNTPNSEIEKAMEATLMAFDGKSEDKKKNKVEEPKKEEPEDEQEINLKKRQIDVFREMLQEKVQKIF